MPFQVSPGVNVSEIDLTTIVPAVSSTEGAFAGVFKWGPIEDRILISNEDELATTFGKPNANNFETFFTAANFLAYGNQLYVSRAASNSYNAVANTDVVGSSILTSNLITINVKNLTDFETKKTTFESSAAYNNVVFIAKYAGDLGNSLRVSVCPTEEAYVKTIKAYNGANNTLLQSNTLASFSISVGSKVANVFTQSTANTLYADLVATDILGTLSVGDIIEVGDATTGVQYMQISALSNITSIAGYSAPNSGSYFNITFDEIFKQKATFTKSAEANAASSGLVNRYWEFFNQVDGAPGVSNYVASRTSNTSIRDEAHIVIVDEGGKFSGVPGQILEVWSNVSRASDAKGEQGGSIFYRDVLNYNSRYVWSPTDILGAALTSDFFPTPSITSNLRVSFAYGKDGLDESTIPVSALAAAYDKFKSAEDVDISLVLCGKARSAVGTTGEDLANYVIDNICETRRDCVAFVSPTQADVVNALGYEASNVVDFRNRLRSTSYAVLDSGYKYQYDKYNDIYRWVPLNGDIAGLCVRTDNTRDPWFSPAGFNRGNIKNIVKLAYNPDKADRDVLYRAGVNPVVNFPGQGTILYGDKTLLARPSAFDRINVRRLFIVLEKAIARAAQSTLFEFNDDFTRAAFRNLIEPYLRDVQGRRGIYDFRVVCDTTNNTPEVIDRNEFRGDIYIKPARSINFIQLNFVAVRTGVEFEEIVGRF